ncbi:class I SAM-dependent methyltransferase [Paraliomyxa miuraensis]|uniref:class I SAM-dependent methyltransferase n=1 Tax=Paraliomyxa miuraensis TaxID=376150 RepID=UPI00225BB335|nr:class I SAM-dependent methyltransferase [Paraliomyxa miuraensis]MCX4241599.1 class I SAM-dependent methyltransferase [Paraliomyxa miuraensis]
MTDDTNPVHEQNRRSWNAVTPAHNSHKHDQAGFLRSGGTTLFPEELELLGDVAGTRLLHLQCNCGQDSLSLAALGAEVTGVDISDAAIDFARTLSADSSLPATFHRSDVLPWLEDAAARGERFDRVFSSYGTITWLEDLPRWARGVASVLAPGGRLVLLEFHPLAWSFDREGKVIEHYFIDGPIEEGGVSDYVGRSQEGLSPMGRAEGTREFANPEKAICYQHTVAQTVQAIADAGLFVEQLREYPHANGCLIFEGMQPLPGRRFGMPQGVPSMPLMLGLVATPR